MADFLFWLLGDTLDFLNSTLIVAQMILVKFFCQQI